MSVYYDQFYCSPCNEYSIIIEDDGRVCYAYLMLKDKIVGDVWIYNRAITPIKAEWNKEEIPFLNPTEYAKTDIVMRPVNNKDDIKIDSIFIDNNCTLDQVKIFIHGNLVAILRHGSKPGWSINAKKDGPIAKTLL